MLTIITTLLPIVALITAFIKKQLKLSGNTLIIVSWGIGIAAGFIYGLTISLVWYLSILVGLAAGLAANGGYDLLKEIIKFINTGKK